MQVDLNTLLNEAAGETVDPVEAPELTETSESATIPDVTTAPETLATPETTETPEAKQEQPASEEKPAKPNPMKEVRDKLNTEQREREKLSNAIQRFSDNDYDFKIKDFKDEKGKVDIDAFIKAMDDADNKAKAEAKGITPEVQAEIDRIEREKIELQKERLKVAMDRAISNLQISKNLDSVAVNSFFKDALEVNKNPYQWLNQGGSLEDLYYLIYRERLMKESVDAAVAKAKEEWESQNNKVAPIPNPAAPATNTSKDTLSIQDLKNLVK